MAMSEMALSVRLAIEKVKAETVLFHIPISEVVIATIQIDSATNKSVAVQFNRQRNAASVQRHRSAHSFWQLEFLLPIRQTLLIVASVNSEADEHTSECLCFLKAQASLDLETWRTTEFKSNNECGLCRRGSGQIQASWKQLCLNKRAAHRCNVGFEALTSPDGTGGLVPRFAG